MALEQGSRTGLGLKVGGAGCLHPQHWLPFPSFLLPTSISFQELSKSLREQLEQEEVRAWARPTFR